MFVLCPHCHFLVGIDPRTGKPPAACPKCGGLVVEPLPESHAEDSPTESAPVATPLAPFVPVELPSVLPTLPEPHTAPELTSAPEPEPRAVAPVAPEPAPEPAIAAAPESGAPAPPRRSWWSRRNAASPEPVTPSSAAPSAPSATAVAAAASAIPEPATEPPEPGRADALIAAIQGRTRTSRKSPSPQPPRVRPAPVSATRSPAVAPPVRVRIAIDEAAAVDTPATPVVVRPVKRQRQAPADVTAPEATPATPSATPAAATPAVAPAVFSASFDIAPADADVPPHPMRRRTDFDPEASTEPAPGAPPHPLRRRTDAPSFTRPRARASSASRIGWRSLVAVGGLSLLLVMQLLLAQRESLAASPRWRPAIAAVCATLRCSLPPWHEPSAFTMLSRDVRPHPNATGTLLINASFRNDARWPQPWPRLVLTLSDLDGRMVGARSFAADEYLGATPTQSELASGQTAAVAMSVVEPAPNIVAFTFDFR